MKKDSKKTKKIIFIAILMLVVFLAINVFVYATEETISVVCEDESMYSKLLDAIPNNYIHSYDASTKTIEIKATSMSSITSLDLSNDTIKNITGIEKFTYLTDLNLSSNNISNLDKISNLINLEKLDLSSNKITDISVLENLTKLTSLKLKAGGEISDISVLANLTGMKNLELSNMGTISNTEAILSMIELENLDLSNTSITNIDNALVPTLKSLNLSSTLITKINMNGDTSQPAKITSCKNLESLSLANCVISDIENIYKTEKIIDGGKTITQPYLINLKYLDYSTARGKKLEIKNLTGFVNLEDLNLSGNSLKNVDDAYKLINLKKLNVSENGISDIDGVVVLGKNGEVVNYLPVETLILKNNALSDISKLQYLVNLKELDLSNGITKTDVSYNGIPDVSVVENMNLSKLSLENQRITMELYKKNNDLDHHIILCDIFQRVRKNNSKIYSNDSDKYIYKGVNVNNEKEEFSQYPSLNVIIPYDTITSYSTLKPELSVTIKGGVADGSTINYKISTSTSSSNVIDSIYCEDENLKNEISKKLIELIETNDEYYFSEIPYTINASKKLINKLVNFDVQNKNISNILGLRNLSELTSLNLSDNNVSNDFDIKYLTKINKLYLTNNKLKGQYTSIESLLKLQLLAIAGNEIDSLDSLQKLIENISKNKQKCQITDLIIANNNIKDISILKNIPTLVLLDINSNYISDLEPIKDLTSLKTLNISSNSILDINILSNVVNLNTFKASNNYISDISVISKFDLNELNLESNEISDISAIATQKALSILNINSNRIPDMSNIENLPLSEFTAKQQKLSYIVNNNTQDEIVIDLPAIFMQAKLSTSKIYTTSDYKVENCSLVEDNTKVKVNISELNNGVAKVTIKGGKAADSIFTIGQGIKASMSYSTTEETEGPVTATISFAKEGVTITNNDGKNTYTFTENGSFEFKFKDENEIEGSMTATVTWIKKPEEPEEETITSETYKINKEKKIISDVKPGVVRKTFVENISSDKTYKILDKNDSEVTDDNTKIGTGYKIKFESNNEYKIAVMGELNGDGDANVIDLAKMQKIILKLTEKDDLLSVAADLNNDNNINVIDIAKLQKHILHIKEL